MALLAHRLNLISSTNEAVMAQQHPELTNITDWEYVLESTSLQENFHDIPRKDWVKSQHKSVRAGGSCLFLAGVLRPHTIEDRP